MELNNCGRVVIVISLMVNLQVLKAEHTISIILFDGTHDSTDTLPSSSNFPNIETLFKVNGSEVKTL